jgi:alcohol dehydrogenase YqhD (iron-dependent ADH family)
MGRTIELSEHAYQTLEAEAQRQGQAPEALLEMLIDQSAHAILYYDDLDKCFSLIWSN